MLLIKIIEMLGNKITKTLFLNLIPIILMIGLILFVKNDISLTVLYLVIIIAGFIIHRERYDLTVFLLGLVIMFFLEWFFISTGVEVFERNSLFGIMPLWLPVLWGYGFVAIKRVLILFNEK